MVSHGAGSSGWTNLAALWVTAGEMRASLEPIEKHMPFAMQGFDCDNGSELNQFLNEIVEVYLLGKKRSLESTRSRAYKKQPIACETEGLHAYPTASRLRKVRRSGTQKHG